MYDIQNRWRLEGGVLQYYGLRNSPNMFQNRVRRYLARQFLNNSQLLFCQPDSVLEHIRADKKAAGYYSKIALRDNA